MAVRVFLLVCLLHFVLSEDLSCEQIRAFVDGHNSRRLQLAQGKIPNQPAASNMKYMIWDNELAEKAAEWSKRFMFKHNKDDTVGSRRFTTGENLYYLETNDLKTELDINKVLDVWFTQYKVFRYGRLNRSDARSRPVGHYTQMAWAKTVYVGCGVSEMDLGDSKRYLVVCNYGPAGNVVGKKPYKRGGPIEELICSGDCSKPYGDKC